MMIVMKELTDRHKLSVRSIGEVFESINGMVSKYRTTDEVRNHDGQKLKKEGLVNAAILYIDSLSYDERTRALNIGMSKLASLLDDERMENGTEETVAPLNPKTGNPLSREPKLKRKPSA